MEFYMNKKLENVLEIGQGISGLAFIVGFIAFFIFAVKQCDTQYTTYQNSLPTYQVYYGNNFSGQHVYFETYKVENNHYTFFDSNGNLIGDFTVSGNNQISIRRNRQ